MADYHIGSFRSIDRFVEDKVTCFARDGYTFEALFSLMFRETENVLYERSEGYRIRKTTYGEAKAEILRKSAALRRELSDLDADSVVGLYMDNSLAWIETFWAILAAGYRPLLMNLRLPEPLLLQAMDACGCKAVISDGKTFDCRTILADSLESAEESCAGAFGTELLVMSSGTSESVKVCAYSAKEFYYQIEDSYAIIRKCGAMKKHYKGNLKQLTFLPFYHVFGLIAMYLWFGFFSRTFVHLNDMSPQTIVNTIKRHKVTHIFAVPLFWEKVYAQALAGIRERGERTWNKFERAMRLQKRLPEPLAALFSKIAFRDLRANLFGDSICFMITGGSSVSPEILSFFNGIGYRLANGYGMTEIGITSVELSSKRRWLCGGYVGGPMTNAEYRVSQEGELQVRGKVLASRIYCGGECRENDGWFDTHDLASCEDGHYLLKGRRDDLIIGPDGENLNPNLLEPRLRSEDVPVCLIGARQGDTIKPVLLASVSRFLASEQLREIEAALIERIADNGLSVAVSKIAFVGEPFMKPDEFKINRLRLTREYEAGTLTLLDPETQRNDEALSELAQQVRGCFAVALDRPEGEIPQDADFFSDLGGSSLDYFGLLAALREIFSLPFPPEDSRLRTVRQITDYIRDNKGGATL